MAWNSLRLSMLAALAAIAAGCVAAPPLPIPANQVLAPERAGQNDPRLSGASGGEQLRGRLSAE